MSRTIFERAQLKSAQLRCDPVVTKSRPFKKGQAFRCGIEGTISVLFRGRGMKRCLLEGPARFEVFVGASVLASNLLRIGAPLERRAGKRARGTPPLHHAA